MDSDSLALVLGVAISSALVVFPSPCFPDTPTPHSQVAIPATDSRKISRMGVYACTATCSMLAYLWLILILMGTSPDVVTLAEVRAMSRWGAHSYEVTTGLSQESHRIGPLMVHGWARKRTGLSQDSTRVGYLSPG